ncbi:MAG: proline dehydrogenase family protein [Terriglobia bacterium]
MAGSQSKWLQERATRYSFVRRAVSRFMPGETVNEALEAAGTLRNASLGAVLTCLGENVTSPEEAEAVTAHYLDVLVRTRERKLTAELSVKLTQLGLDFDQELCYRNLARIAGAAVGSAVWIDMESTRYVDATLELYRRSRLSYPNTGVCLQAYLYRTAADLESLLPLGPAIRLVKGAYKEPADRAFPHKHDVDENFFALATRLLSPEARAARVRAAIATHDLRLIQRLIQYTSAQGLPKDCLEFHMLYGIQRAEQLRLAREGWRSMVLIAYGKYWFPWYMRRLAERPANAWFVLRSLLSA